MTARVAAEGLSAAFGGMRAVRDLSLRLEEGARLALVGESGSGKTLTALALTGLAPRAAQVTGRIVWADGGPVPGRDFGLVLQDPMSSLNPVLTIGEQIGEVVETHFGLSRKQGRARAIELLEDVGIAEPRRRVEDHPHRFSGGQRQRIALAIAIAGKPKLLIADEPTTALDTLVQAEIVRLLDRLTRARGMGLLLITHDLTLAAQLTDEIAALYAGRLVERGPTRRILHRPRHPYLKELAAARLDFDRARKGRLAEVSGAAAAAEGCPFAPRCPYVRPDCLPAFPAWIGSAEDGVACVLYERGEPA